MTAQKSLSEKRKGRCAFCNWPFVKEELEHIIDHNGYKMCPDCQVEKGLRDQFAPTEEEEVHVQIESI